MRKSRIKEAKIIKEFAEKSMESNQDLLKKAFKKLKKISVKKMKEESSEKNKKKMKEESSEKNKKKK